VLERGPLSLVSTVEELRVLEKKGSGSYGYEEFCLVNKIPYDLSKVNRCFGGKSVGFQQTTQLYISEGTSHCILFVISVPVGREILCISK
jgi:hypothetical protein